MTNEEVFDVLLSTQIYEEKNPQGSKNDIYIVINSKNDSNRTNFPDDYGVWDSTCETTVN